MIHSKEELRFFIASDMMMNRGKFKWSIKDRIRNFFLPDFIMQYLKSMRYVQYLSDCKVITPPRLFLLLYHRLRFRRLGLKLGFSIGYHCLDYGTIISHYGTIVVGNSNRIGKYAVLNTSVCISDNGKVIGDAAYISTGVKMTSRIRVGDNVSIGANSLVNKDVPDNCMVGGVPAKVIKPEIAWYIRDGEEYFSRVRAVEELKRSMKLYDI